MSLTTTEVTYHVEKPDGSIWRHRLAFELIPGGYDADGMAPGHVVYGSVDANGDGSIDLWANEGGNEASRYRCTLPSGETFYFTVPTSGGPYTLSALREAGITVSDPQFPTIISILSELTAQNVQLHGALGDGVTIDDAGFAAAIAALPDWGGIIDVPPTEKGYRITASINPGSKRVTIRGYGWKCLVAALFGDSQWANYTGSTYVSGSVLRMTGTQDAVKTTADSYRGLQLEHIAIIGPGSGTSTGVNIGTGSNSNEHKFYNLLVANFYTGVRQNDSFDNQFDIMVRGCVTGWRMAGTVTDTVFDWLSIQNCTLAMYGVGSGVRIKSGLIQGNGDGIQFAPSVSEAVGAWSIEHIWFEAQSVAYGGTGKDVILDATSANVGLVVFRSCRSGVTYTLAPVVGVSTTVAGLRFVDCDFAGVTLRLINGIDFVELVGTTRFASDSDWAYDGIGPTRLHVHCQNPSGRIDSRVSYSVGNLAAGSFAPDMRNGDLQHGVITGNLTIDVPTHAPVDIVELEVLLRQDGVGGYNLTAGSGILGAALSNVGNTAARYTLLRYRRNVAGVNSWLVEQVPYYDG